MNKIQLANFIYQILMEGVFAGNPAELMSKLPGRIKRQPPALPSKDPSGVNTKVFNDITRVSQNAELMKRFQPPDRNLLLTILQKAKNQQLGREDLSAWQMLQKKLQPTAPQQQQPVMQKAQLKDKSSDLLKNLTESQVLNMIYNMLLENMHTFENAAKQK